MLIKDLKAMERATAPGMVGWYRHRLIACSHSSMSPTTEVGNLRRARPMS